MCPWVVHFKRPLTTRKKDKNGGLEIHPTTENQLAKNRLYFQTAPACRTHGSAGRRGAHGAGTRQRSRQLRPRRGYSSGRGVFVGVRSCSWCTPFEVYDKLSLSAKGLRRIWTVVIDQASVADLKFSITGIQIEYETPSLLMGFRGQRNL